jgi:hypothetical protein
MTIVSGVINEASLSMKQALYGNLFAYFCRKAINGRAIIAISWI